MPNKGIERSIKNDESWQLITEFSIGRSEVWRLTELPLHFHVISLDKNFAPHGLFLAKCMDVTPGRMVLYKVLYGEVPP